MIGQREQSWDSSGNGIRDSALQSLNPHIKLHSDPTAEHETSSRESRTFETIPSDARFCPFNPGDIVRRELFIPIITKYFNVVRREQIRLRNLGGPPRDRIAGNLVHRMLCQRSGDGIANILDGSLRQRATKSNRVKCCFVINAQYKRDDVTK